MDVAYIRDMSLLEDTRIILKTVLAVVHRYGE